MQLGSAFEASRLVLVPFFFLSRLCMHPGVTPTF
jgi:hypothetical protein